MNNEIVINNYTEKNVEDVESTSIHMLNDDCLMAIFQIFTESIHHNYGDYDDRNYSDILLEMQLARVCTRFLDIFIELIWKSKEKHLTLRPHQMYRTMGPMNYLYYIQAMQWKLEKLELEEHFLHWFLDLANTANIHSFPGIKICLLRNTLLTPVKEVYIRKLIIFLPNLRCLSLGTALNVKDFIHLEALEEFRFYNYYPMEFSYFQSMCNSLKNVHVLNICSPLRWDEPIDEEFELTIDSLPENIEILHLNVSYAKLAFNAILKLNKLQKLVLTMINTQCVCENIDVVNTFLLKKMEELTGFGFNKMYENVLRIWKFPSKLGNTLKISKLIFSSYECIPAIIDFERCIDFQKVNHLCLRNCFILQNDTVLKLVELAVGLLHLDITRCYLIDVKSLLNSILGIREKQNVDQSDVIGPLCIYNVDEDMETPYTKFWKSQRFVTKGDKCPIDIEDAGIIFDFV